MNICFAVWHLQRTKKQREKKNIQVKLFWIIAKSESELLSSQSIMTGHAVSTIKTYIFASEDELCLTTLFQTSYKIC